MALSVLVMIKEEVTCPVCLHLMVEPVSADCGHSFCHVCITLNYDSSKGKKAKGICPVCGVSFRFGTLRSNRHVANIVERLKRFKCCPEEKQKVFYCPWHREKLQLLCEKDMVAICNLCEGSQDHLDHKPAPIEEVAYKYEEKLQAALQMQMANEKRCEEWGDDYRNALTYWVNQIHSEEENVQMEFKGLREFLDSKEKSELQKLMQEKEGIMNSLAESQTELEKQREAVRDLISDVEHQLKCSTIEMLQVRLQEVPASESQETWKPLPSFCAAVIFLMMTTGLSVPSLNSFLSQFQRLENHCMHGWQGEIAFFFSLSNTVQMQNLVEKMCCIMGSFYPAAMLSMCEAHFQLSLSLQLNLKLVEIISPFVCMESFTPVESNVTLHSLWFFPTSCLGSATLESPNNTQDAVLIMKLLALLVSYWLSLT